MIDRTALHVIAAMSVVGLAATAALAFPGSCHRVTTQPESESRSRAVCQFVIKKKGGGGGKLKCELDGTVCYETDFAQFSGSIGIPVGDSVSWQSASFFAPGGRGTKVGDSSGRYKFNTQKDDPSEAGSLLSAFTFFAGSANNATISSPMKSKVYQPLTEGFSFETGKIAGKSRVFDDFSKYTGSFKAKFKGTTISGAKVNGQFKVAFKNAERSF